jgi:hypothetical protein
MIPPFDTNRGMSYASDMKHSFVPAFQQRAEAEPREIPMSVAVQADYPTPIPDARQAELRQHPRIVCVDGGVLRLAVRPEFRGRRAMMVDISTGGIGFVLQEPLAPDTVFVFEVTSEEGLDTVGRLARVRHCRPHPTPADAPWLQVMPLVSRIFRSMFRRQAPPEGHAWFVGCEFDRPLRDTELKVLLECTQAVHLGQHTR